MDIKYILEQAKELLIRDKKLLPVLIVEKENGDVTVTGLVFENDIDRMGMMMNIGRRFAEDTERIKSLSLVGDVYISRLDNKGKFLGKDEAIAVSRYYVDTGKKEIIVQVYEKSDDNIIWKDTSQELDSSRFYLLEAFMQGYEMKKMGKVRYN